MHICAAIPALSCTLIKAPVAAFLLPPQPAPASACCSTGAAPWVCWTYRLAPRWRLSESSRITLRHVRLNQQGKDGGWLVGGWKPCSSELGLCCLVVDGPTLAIDPHPCPRRRFHVPCTCADGRGRPQLPMEVKGSFLWPTVSGPAGHTVSWREGWQDAQAACPCLPQLLVTYCFACTVVHFGVVHYCAGRVQRFVCLYRHHIMQPRSCQGT